MLGPDIRDRMRDKKNVDVADSGQALAGVIAGMSRRYSEDFRREVIQGQWADIDSENRIAEFRIGDKYKNELQDTLSNPSSSL